MRVNRALSVQYDAKVILEIRVEMIDYICGICSQHSNCELERGENGQITAHTILQYAEAAQEMDTNVRAVAYIVPRWFGCEITGIPSVRNRFCGALACMPRSGVVLILDHGTSE